MGSNHGTLVVGATKSDINTTGAAVLSASTNRVFVEIQNQSDVTIRVAIGEVATTTNGFRVPPGDVFFEAERAPSAFSVCSESGSSKVIYMTPASEV